MRREYFFEYREVSGKKAHLAVGKNVCGEGFLRTKSETPLTCQGGEENPQGKRGALFDPGILEEGKCPEIAGGGILRAASACSLSGAIGRAAVDTIGG